MNFTEEQLRIAEEISNRVELLIAAKVEDGEIFAKMGDHLPAFKRLMDSMSSEALNRLCQRFPGLYHFGKILQHLAELIQTGQIKVPK